MKVTRVSINDFTPEHKIKATATVVLDDVLCIHHIHIIEGVRGLYVAFPNTGVLNSCRRNNKYKDIVHPCNEMLRKEIAQSVLEKYKAVSI